MLKSLKGTRRWLASFAVVLALTAIIVTPAMAITNGQPDGSNHPQVGLMVAQNADGNPLWRCSGTLMSSTVFLTAGHCTAPDGADNPAHVEIWFESGPIPLAAGYPSSTPGDRCDGISAGYPCVGDVGGTPYTHPDWNPDVFYYRDLGIVILDTPYTGTSAYGTLPTLNAFDAWKTRRGLTKPTFDSVGYGLQKSFPTATAWKNAAVRQRMIAHPKLNQINGGIVGNFSLLLSNNTHTGGTCFGDSGGPNFIAGGLVVAGVTSFGLNSTCGGTGGVFRMDRQWSLDFVNDALTNGAALDHYSGD